MSSLESKSGLGAFSEDYQLSSRELEILKALNQEGESTVAFQGLKRKLGLHQETLSRALTRLHRDGLIERTTEGYRINKKASQIQLPVEYSERTLPIAQSYLPPIDLHSLVQNLRGSWFGRLRWLRYSEIDAETVLTWITEDGDAQIDLRISDDSMTIQAQVKENTDVRKAVIAAHELYGRVSNLCTKPVQQGGILLLQTESLSRAS